MYAIIPITETRAAMRRAMRDGVRLFRTISPGHPAPHVRLVSAQPDLAFMATGCSEEEMMTAWKSGVLKDCGHGLYAVWETERNPTVRVLDLKENPDSEWMRTYGAPISGLTLDDWEAALLPLFRGSTDNAAGPEDVPLPEASMRSARTWIACVSAADRHRLMKGLRRLVQLTGEEHIMWGVRSMTPGWAKGSQHAATRKLADAIGYAYAFLSDDQAQQLTSSSEFRPTMTFDTSEEWVAEDGSRVRITRNSGSGDDTYSLITSSADTPMQGTGIGGMMAEFDRLAGVREEPPVPESCEVGEGGQSIIEADDEVEFDEDYAYYVTSTGGADDWICYIWAKPIGNGRYELTVRASGEHASFDLASRMRANIDDEMMVVQMGVSIACDWMSENGLEYDIDSRLDRMKRPKLEPPLPESIEDEEFQLKPGQIIRAKYGQTYEVTELKGLRARILYVKTTDSNYSAYKKQSMLTKLWPDSVVAMKDEDGEWVGIKCVRIDDQNGDWFTRKNNDAPPPLPENLISEESEHVNRMQAGDPVELERGDVIVFKFGETHFDRVRIMTPNRMWHLCAIRSVFTNKQADFEGVGYRLDKWVEHGSPVTLIRGGQQLPVKLEQAPAGWGYYWRLIVTDKPAEDGVPLPE